MSNLSSDEITKLLNEELELDQRETLDLVHFERQKRFQRELEEEDLTHISQLRLEDDFIF